MEVWLTSRPESSRSSLPPARLEASLQVIIDRARQAWPDLGLELGTFVAFLGERIDPADADAVCEAERHAADLYLACACSLGDRLALGQLGRRYGGDVERALRSFAKDGGVAEDAQQRMLERVCFGSEDRPARITSYGGRGPLGAWLRAAAVREALMMLREERAEGNRRGFDVPDAALDPELAVLKARYGEIFRRAFAEAHDALQSQDRTLLRFKYSDGASIDAIAAVYRVHRATAARWLARIRDTLFEETRRRMMADAGLSDSEFDSVIRLVESQLDVSLSGY